MLSSIIKPKKSARNQTNLSKRHDNRTRSRLHCAPQVVDNAIKPAASPCGTRKYSILQQIREALIKSGYRKLDQQAKALGLRRSTAWTIVNAKHKLGRLSAKTTTCILANPDTPPSVRSVIQKYLAERSGVLASRAKRLTRREQQSNRLRAVRY